DAFPDQDRVSYKTAGLRTGQGCDPALLKASFPNYCTQPGITERLKMILTPSAYCACKLRLEPLTNTVGTDAEWQEASQRGLSGSSGRHFLRHRASRALGQRRPCEASGLSGYDADPHPGRLSRGELASPD